jgi:hypothetical protein
MSTVPRPLLGSLALLALLAACGSEVTSSTGDAPESPVESSIPEPKGLTCPTAERVASSGGLLAEPPKGPDTAEELVESKSTAEEPWVLVGRKAYVLRPDGTAFEVHDLVEGPKGWFLDGYEACAG